MKIKQTLAVSNAQTKPQQAFEHEATMQAVARLGVVKDAAALRDAIDALHTQCRDFLAKHSPRAVGAELRNAGITDPIVRDNLLGLIAEVGHSREVAYRVCRDVDAFVYEPVDEVVWCDEADDQLATQEGLR